MKINSKPTFPYKLLTPRIGHSNIAPKGVSGPMARALLTIRLRRKQLISDSVQGARDGFGRKGGVELCQALRQARGPLMEMADTQ